MTDPARPFEHGSVQCRSRKSAAPIGDSLKRRRGGVDRAQGAIGVQAAGDDTVRAA